MRRVLQVVLPLLVIAAGVGAAWLLIVTRPQAAQAPIENTAVPVEVIEATPGDHRIAIEAMGVVKPVRQVILQPEVSGRIVEQNPRLKPGGRLEAGDMVVRVDARDYAAAVSGSTARVQQAQVALEEERASKRVAEYEWKGASERLPQDARDYALREPHIQSARARIESARSQLRQAKRNLGRTTLRAPFDAIVIEESVDVGQVVGPATPVATLAGVRRFWVQIDIPPAKLSFLDIPGVNTSEAEGSRARIVHEPGPGARIEREGFVDRLLGNVDDRGRMAQLLVAVEDPLALGRDPESRPLPLLLGTYVNVRISGRILQQVFTLPAETVSDGHVWVVGSDNRIEHRAVEVAWEDTDHTVVSSGLRAGDRVVTTVLSVATPGMLVSVQSQAKSSDDESTGAATVATLEE